jgi:hypothetical protein
MSCRIVQTALVVVFAAVLPMGCGGDDKWAAERPQRVPTGGTVLYNDQPVEGATVLFLPQGHNHAATGRTDSSGRFRLQTFDPGDGAVPGEYKVTIRKSEVSSAGGDQQDDDFEHLEEPEERSLLPERYAGAETSGFTASVAEGGDNDFSFELTD